jgi:GrpB-like predicted nucleotidyltransferase (UPF0157 family)
MRSEPPSGRGAGRAPIQLAPYSPEWVPAFAAERDALQAVLPAPKFRVEHVGSTAVPGLYAKPIIDLVVGAPSLRAIERRMPGLAALGYRHVPGYEADLPQRRYFHKPATGPHRFHLHAVARDDPFFARLVQFRDRLRAEPALAAAYLALKLELARRCGDDHARYAEAKSPFVRAVIAGPARAGFRRSA